MTKYKIKRIDGDAAPKMYVAYLDLDRARAYPQNNTILVTGPRPVNLTLKYARAWIRIQNHYYPETRFKYTIVVCTKLEE